jgi:MFS transporter, YQGE family, putative transporter
MNGMHEQDNHVLKYLMNKKELNELYVSMVLRTLAFSMIGIFVPLFLFKELSYSLTSIIHFYLVYALSFFIFTPAGVFLIRKIGFKHSMLLSSPLYVCYFALLYFLKDNPYLFFIVPLVYGAGEGIFWLAFHTDFAMFSEKSKRGNQIGKFYSFSLLAGLIGPMVGGVILTFSGFTALFIIVSIFILGSTIPLLFSKDVKRDCKFSWNFLKAGSLRDLISFSAIGGKGIVVMVFWPIFIYSILNLYVAMGSMFTFLGVFSLIVTHVIGKLTDVFNKRKLIKWFSISQSIVWFVKIFVKTKMELIGISMISSLTGIGCDLPYTAITYNKSKKSVEYLVFREFGLTIGRIIVLLLVLASGSLMSSFLYASVASLGYMLL